MEAAPHPWPALGVLLLRDGLVTKEALEAVLDEQVDTRQQRISSRRLGELLVERGMVTATQVAELVAEQYELPFADLDVADIELRAAHLLTEELARRLSAVTVAARPDDSYLVAIADPSAVLFSDELRRALGGQPTFVMVGVAAMDAALEFVYEQQPGHGPEEPAVQTDAMGILLELPSSSRPREAAGPSVWTARPNAGRWPPLGALLVREGLVTEADLDAALAQQRLSSSRRLGEILVDRGSVTTADVARLVAEQYELPFLDLAHVEIDPQVARLLPEDIARRRFALPIERLPDDTLQVVVADPTNVFQSDELRAAMGAQVTFAVAAPEQIEAAIRSVHDVVPPSAVVYGDAAEPDEQREPEATASVDGVPESESEADVETYELELSEADAADTRADVAPPSPETDTHAVEPLADEPAELLSDEMLEPPVAYEPPEVPSDEMLEPSVAYEPPEVPSDEMLEPPVAYEPPEVPSDEMLAPPLADSREETPSDETFEPAVATSAQQDDLSEPHSPPADGPQLDEELLAEVEETVAVALEAPSEAADEPVEDPPAGELDEAIRRALTLGATEIRLTPQPRELVVRARIDGVLREVASFEDEWNGTLGRLAALAGLDPSARGPRCGLLAVANDERTVQLQVTALPTKLGLQLTLHVHGGVGYENGLSDLGMRPDTEAAVREALRRTSGVVLVCGAPLSGRTTTLYAALHELASPGRALATVEDPVERLVPGVEQLDVDASAGPAFAPALRGALRSGADAVLVGDLPDSETARVALRGARGRRLVLASLDATDTASAVGRLTHDLGVEPELVASTLSCLVAQHLVRRVCTECRETYYASADEIAALGRPEEEAGRRLLARGRGCPSCAGTGYDGWAGVFELLPATDEIRALVRGSAATSAVREAAARAGMSTLREEAVGLCLDGVTTVPEVQLLPRD